MKYVPLSFIMVIYLVKNLIPLLDLVNIWWCWWSKKWF